MNKDKQLPKEIARRCVADWAGSNPMEVSRKKVTEAIIEERKEITDLKIKLGLLEAKCGMLYDIDGKKVGKTVFERIKELKGYLKAVGLCICCGKKDCGDADG